MTTAPNRFGAASFLFSGLQQVRALAAEGDERVVSDLEGFLSDGAVIRDLDEGIAHADVIVLVGAHEAAQLHLAGYNPIPD